MNDVITKYTQTPVKYIALGQIEENRQGKERHHPRQWRETKNMPRDTLAVIFNY